MKKEYWIARDKCSNNIYVYCNKPIKQTTFFTQSTGGYRFVDRNYYSLFTNLTFENSPVRIRVKTKSKKVSYEKK